MNKKSIDAVDVASKRVLVRVDFNVPLDDARRVADDTRIRAALPTLNALLRRGARLILMSHLGRPDEEPDQKQRCSLAPVAAALSDRLGRPVRFVRDCVGPAVRAAVAELRDGDVLLLENLRFHEAETIKDKNAAKDPALRQTKDDFARQLAELADVYVNDAFGTCHRDNASMLTVPQMMKGRPRVAGYLVLRELDYLGRAVSAPKRPFVCVLGGAKVSDKIRVIERLLGVCDALLIGGAMMFTFWRAQGYRTGRSKVEPEAVELATRLIAGAGDKLRIPMDCIAAAEIRGDAATDVCSAERGVPDDRMGLDIGPATVEAFERTLSGAGTIVWNGPMGVFEVPPFDRGTVVVARALAAATKRGAITVIGGGDSASAVAHAGLTDQMSHVSTGGGASLEFLEGRFFPAIDVLDDA